MSDSPILGDSDPSWMSWTKDPIKGKWSEPAQIFKDYKGADTK